MTPLEPTHISTDTVCGPITDKISEPAASLSATGEAIVSADNFIRVSEAKERYFGGSMSLRWWYRQIEQGRLTHYRAGGTVLLRTRDIEVFVSDGLRTKQRSEQAPTPATKPPSRQKPRSPPTPGGLRFFGG